MKWEVVIGLETHVELATGTKIFCGCSTAFGAAANTQCCPVCTGMPGTLPVLNRSVLDYAVRTGLALNCQITRRQKFDRKNYFYPDLPKGYQISQLYAPAATAGSVRITTAQGEKVIRIHEMHMEEDAGKLTHDPDTGLTRADYNRCGVPLIEIVTEPDFRSAEEVIAYLEKLKSTLEYLEVSDCKMQEGSLRCDINVSVRPMGSTALGQRIEMKNLSSFRSISRAIDHEARRQIEVLEAGGTILQETRRWDEDKLASYSMRSKESAQDYRYFPEPDIPPILLTDGYIQAVRGSLPELAEEKQRRYVKQFGLPAYDAQTITSQKALASFFECCVALGGQPKTVANWIMGEVLRALKERHLEAGEIRLQPQTLVSLLALVQWGRINRNTAAEVFEAIFDTDTDPETYVKEHHLEQIDDEELVEAVVNRVFAEQTRSVADYRAGKKKALGFLVGQTMRALEGKADPKLVHAVILAKLEKS